MISGVTTKMDELKFDFEEAPSWRTGGKKTSEMLLEISEFVEQYDRLPSAAREFCENDFAKAMAVDYVYHLNVGESVGTQSKEETKEVLERFLKKKDLGKDCSRENLETVNTYEAMKAMHTLHEEMKHTGFLTVPQLCDVHGGLLKGLHSGPGKVRKSEAYTTWDNSGPYFYPSPEKSEQLFYSCIDHHNIHMESLGKATMTTQEKVKYIFKCASWLLFHFVDAHPFGDGNGRMCRLLANYVVSLITPFPVSVYHPHRSERSGREDYVNAIVQCRKNPDKGPRELATMLVEGVWYGWKSLFENLEQRGEDLVLGPVVVQKSKVDDISKRVKQVCLHKSYIDAEKAIENVRGKILSADVSGLKPHEYVEMEVEVDGSACIKVKLFP